MSTWMKHFTADGSTYFHNEEDDSTQWSRPDGYVSGGEEEGEEEDSGGGAIVSAVEQVSVNVDDQHHYDLVEAFEDFTFEDGFLFEFQSLGLFNKFELTNPKAAAKDALAKIEYVVGKLEEGVGEDADWVLAVHANDFAFIEYLLCFLNHTGFEMMICSKAAQCLAFVGNICPTMWSEYMSNKDRVETILNSTILNCKKISELATSQASKPANNRNQPYLGYDERDAKDFNIPGYTQTTQTVIGADKLEDKATVILVFLLLTFQFFAKEIKNVKESPLNEECHMGDIEKACQLTLSSIDEQYDYVVTDDGIVPNQAIVAICRHLLLLGNSFGEDAYIMSIKTLSALNRQSNYVEQLSTTEVAKIVVMLQFDPDYNQSEEETNVSEGLLHLLNDIGCPDHDVPESVPVINFCTDLVCTDEADGFFYVNDIKVIIDLIVRELFNIPFLTEEEKQEQEQQQEQEQAFDADELRIYYMKFAAAITQRHPEGLYNQAEVNDALSYIDENTEDRSRTLTECHKVCYETMKITDGLE